MVTENSSGKMDANTMDNGSAESRVARERTLTITRRSARVSGTTASVRSGWLMTERLFI